LKSKVLNKIVYISDNDEICYCEESFYKTCISRIANDLPCCEMMVRFTPVDREGGSDSTRAGDDDLLDAMKKSKQFLKTLDHLDRMK